MSALYVTEQGALIRRTGERLLVTKNGEVLQDVQIVHVEQVVVMGNIQLTTPAMALLLQKEIDVVFLTAYGKFRGRLMTTGSKFAQLRHRQLQLAQDERLALPLAQALVAAKLHGQAEVLRRWNAGRAAGGVSQGIGQAQQAASLDTLRGHEGSAGAAYFGGIRALIPAAWKFERRAYHPPTDPVNALLSFGYTLLLKDVTAAAQLVGLDPYLGVFHAMDYGRPSLCLDLMEPFRPVVDDLVLGAILNQAIVLDAFKTRPKDSAVLLKESERKPFLQAFEGQMAHRVSAPGEAERTSVRRCIELQARSWARVALGKTQSFEPFRFQSRDWGAT